MARNYKTYSYFSNRPDVVKIWNDLEQYLDFCRFELREFNPAHLYDRSNYNFRAFLNRNRPKRHTQPNRKPFRKN